jgi:hypothetical protein
MGRALRGELAIAVHEIEQDRWTITVERRKRRGGSEERISREAGS